MSDKNYDSNPRWYVVHTYSGYENKVKTDLEKTIKNRELEDFFFEIVVPMEISRICFNQNDCDRRILVYC